MFSGTASTNNKGNWGFPKKRKNYGRGKRELGLENGPTSSTKPEILLRTEAVQEGGKSPRTRINSRSKKRKIYWRRSCWKKGGKELSMFW